MSRATTIEASYRDELRLAADRFGDHEDMSIGVLLQWLCQFDDSHIPTALKVLENTRYYNGLNIRTLSRQLVKLVDDEFSAREYPSVAVVPVGGPGSGAMVMARIIRDAVNGTRCRVLDMLGVARARPREFAAVVFIEDFSGSGSTLEKWWATVEPVVRPLDAEVALGILVLNYRARERVKAIASRVLWIDELDQASDVFDAACKHFTDEEKRVLLGYSRRTGCRPKFARGYGDCGLILSFKHGCPNNSIAALWHSSPTWRAPFKRRAV